MVRALKGFTTLKGERGEKEPGPPRYDNRPPVEVFAFLKNQLSISSPALQDFEVACVPVRARCKRLPAGTASSSTPSYGEGLLLSSQTSLKESTDQDDAGAAPLSHQQHRYQLTDCMAFSLRSKRLSIPKGEEPGFTAAVVSRSFREKRGFDHLTARSVHSPKERRISAAILGTEPRKLPSPRRPGFSPGPLRLHLRRQNRGVQNRPGSGLGVRATVAQLRAGVPTSRSRERATYTPAAEPAGTRPSFPKPGHSLRKVCAPLHRKVCASDAGAGRVPTPVGISPPSPGRPTRFCWDPPGSRSARLPHPHSQDRNSILPPAEDGSVDSPGRWKRR